MTTNYSSHVLATFRLHLGDVVFDCTVMGWHGDGTRGPNCGSLDGVVMTGSDGHPISEAELLPMLVERELDLFVADDLEREAELDPVAVEHWLRNLGDRAVQSGTDDAAYLVGAATWTLNWREEQAYSREFPRSSSCRTPVGSGS